MQIAARDAEAQGQAGICWVGQNSPCNGNGNGWRDDPLAGKSGWNNYPRIVGKRNAKPEAFWKSLFNNPYDSEFSFGKRDADPEAFFSDIRKLLPGDTWLGKRDAAADPEAFWKSLFNNPYDSEFSFGKRDADPEAQFSSIRKFFNPWNIQLGKREAEADPKWGAFGSDGDGLGSLGAWIHGGDSNLFDRRAVNKREADPEAFWKSLFNNPYESEFSFGKRDAEAEADPEAFWKSLFNNPYDSEFSFGK